MNASSGHGPGPVHDDGRLYFRQLLAGRDFAAYDAFATDMANYVYLVGDREAGEAVVVDAAYAPVEIVALVEADGLALVGAVLTHYHADHAGGTIADHAIAGVTALLEVRDVPVHVHRDELAWVRERTGLPEGSAVAHGSGDVIHAGELALTVIHTPGHTEGSQCLMVERHLLTGDTLFLDGCGRTDLPGGDPAQLYESLTRRLAPIPDAVAVFPGHAYSRPPSESMGELRRHNPVLAPLDRERWLARFG